MRDEQCSRERSTCGTQAAGIVLQEPDLERASEAVKAAEHELEARRAELRAVIVEADELGLPVARIAELTGLTRRSVYNALKRAGRR